jgi:ribokinase
VSVSQRLIEVGVRHHPLRVRGQQADWTLLVTSGRFGDKLPIGFRGCHAALDSLGGAISGRGACDLRVVASLPNRLAAEALAAPGSRVRLFAPAMRNMGDQSTRVSSFSRWIDVLCCNRREWEALEDREQVAWQVSILAVTDGPAGSVVRFTTPEGEPGRYMQPAFPRTRPPIDTNRAGESFASTLIATLLDGGWTPGVSDPALVRAAAERASAAAALVLDRAGFGFPTADEVDAALRAGRAGGPVARGVVDVTMPAANLGETPRG